MILLFIVIAVTAVYVTVAPDRRTLAFTRGLLGGFRTGSRAGNQAIGRASRPAKPSLISDIREILVTVANGFKWLRIFGREFGPAYREAADAAELARETRKAERIKRKAEKKEWKEKRRQKALERKAKREEAKWTKVDDDNDEEWTIPRLLGGDDDDDKNYEHLEDETLPENSTPHVSAPTKENTMTVLAGEYTSPADISADLNELQAACEAEELARIAWMEAIEARREVQATIRAKYESSDITTDALTSSITGVDEVDSALGVLEHIPVIEAAVNEAEQLGEHVGSIGADAHTSSFENN